MVKAGNTLVLVVYCMMILLFIDSCSFSSKTCVQLLTRSMNEKYDIIVVPGVPFNNSKWDSTMKARVYWSKYLYQKGIAKNIMYSGSAVYSPYYEGEIMGMYAEAIGIPREHIYTETKAEHSTENIYYSYKKAKKAGFNRIALATDPFQAKMLKSFILKRISPDVGIIPIVHDTLISMRSQMTDPVIDYTKAFVKDFISLPEREGFWKRWKGTRGLDMDRSLYE